MLEVFKPLCRQFSAIEELQSEYSLIYTLDVGDQGGRLTLCRTGKDACVDSLELPLPPQRCYGVLLYLYENAVQPELWRDIVAEHFPLAKPGVGKGGVVCEG